MTIRMHFADPVDSPTGATPVRLRYQVHEGTSVLTYRHGQAHLTREAWARYRQAGARIEVDTDRDRAVVREALGADAT